MHNLSFSFERKFTAKIVPRHKPKNFKKFQKKFVE